MARLVTPVKVCEALSGKRFSYVSEAELQQAVTDVLDRAGLKPVREVLLGGRADRIDVLCDRVGVEVKLGTARTEDVYRQLGRYARSGHVSALVLVTTSVKHLSLPQSISGIPLHTVCLAGRAL